MEESIPVTHAVLKGWNKGTHVHVERRSFSWKKALFEIFPIFDTKAAMQWIIYSGCKNMYLWRKIRKIYSHVLWSLIKTFDMQLTWNYWACFASITCLQNISCHLTLTSLNNSSGLFHSLFWIELIKKA